MRCRRSAVRRLGIYIPGMNLTISSRDQAAIADLSHRNVPRSMAGHVAFAAGLTADARAQTRVSAAMPTRVRTAQDERPGCIRNVSPRGVMLAMARPPMRGESVEIVTGHHSLAGQVRWVSNDRAGIEFADAIDVGALLSAERSSIAAQPRPARTTFAMPAVVHSPRDSHIVARQLQFAAMVAFGVVAAFMIAFCVSDLLTDIVDQVRTGLPG